MDGVAAKHGSLFGFWPPATHQLGVVAEAGAAREISFSAMRACSTCCGPGMMPAKRISRRGLKFAHGPLVSKAVRRESVRVEEQTVHRNTANARSKISSRTRKKERRWKEPRRTFVCRRGVAFGCHASLFHQSSHERVNLELAHTFGSYACVFTEQRDVLSVEGCLV